MDELHLHTYKDQSLNVCIRKREGKSFFYSLYVSFTLISGNVAVSSILQCLSTLHHQPYESYIFEAAKAADSVPE